MRQHTYHVVVQLEGCCCHDLQWAERLLLEGQTEQWGDKWEERFKEGKGSKKVPIKCRNVLCSPCCVECQRFVRALGGGGCQNVLCSSCCVSQSVDTCYTGQPEEQDILLLNPM